MKQFPYFYQVDLLGLFWDNSPNSKETGLFPQIDGSWQQWATMSWEHTPFVSA